MYAAHFARAGSVMARFVKCGFDRFRTFLADGPVSVAHTAAFLYGHAVSVRGAGFIGFQNRFRQRFGLGVDAHRFRGGRTRGQYGGANS